MSSIRLYEWLTLLSVVLGPILAVQVQKFLEDRREKRRRCLALFHTLMATRADRLSGEHVRALNMIDLEFYGRTALGLHVPSKAEKAVTNAWHKYIESLGRDTNFAERDSLFFGMLYQMALALGYRLDEAALRRDCYSPRAHGEDRVLDAEIRDGLAKVLTEKRALRVSIYTEGAPTSESPGASSL
ncbi:DUF6680 family protein [Gemmatimonas sp.]|jgi:hypothetical protein|uniref:DUF6680 family protein n=1 Tax=Gemmatimonas sp. TaxID=1962908 RepID=UPI00391F88FC